MLCSCVDVISISFTEKEDIAGCHQHSNMIRHEKEKSNGPEIEPCGTPHKMMVADEAQFPVGIGLTQQLNMKKIS